MSMVGISLGSVCHLKPRLPKDIGITVLEPPGESLYETILSSHKPLNRIYLTAFSFEDLELQTYCQTKDIYEAAAEQGAEIVPYTTALQIPAELPTMFHPGFIARVCGKKLPFKKCLIGVEPITGSDGQQYVIELSDGTFRFRRASPYDEWPDDVWWVFATWS
jgi:hypothetical protein